MEEVDPSSVSLGMLGRKGWVGLGWVERREERDR